jgi:transcriptional regulator with XRE-family HTH domain
VTPEELAKRDEFIRTLRKRGCTINELCEQFSLGESAISRIIKGKTRTQEHLERCTKPLQMVIDVETQAQVEVLMERWGLRKSEVVKILIDWGLEALDGPEKTLCEEAARSCEVGAL